VRTEVSLRVEVVEAEGKVLVLVDVPVQLRQQLVVVGVEEIPFVRTGS
jgi:hypothetical protein